MSLQAKVSAAALARLRRSRTFVVGKTQMIESRPGRKKLHGSPAYGGDIAQIFDYQNVPCEKEAAAKATGDGAAESVGGRGV
jgi:hypothetical protein